MREFVRYLTYPFRLLARLPASIISAPGRFMGMTLPTRVAIVVAFALLLVSVVYFILKRFDPDPPGFQEYLRDGLIVFALIVVTAIVARMAVKTWLEKDYSRFPEIDQAWNAGSAALRGQGVDVIDTPVFLVLGVGSKYEADALFHASGLSLCVDGQPLERGWLHWYATADAIYLVLTQTCRMGALKGKLFDSGDKLDHGSDLIRQTINPESPIRGTATICAARARPNQGRMQAVVAASRPCEVP